MHNTMMKMAKLMGMLGGLVLFALIAVTTLSVIGRMLNTIGHSFAFLESTLTIFGPIKGDYEIVEAGVAFAIMAFFPWCQLNRSHASVELFTSMLPTSANRFLALIWELVFALVLMLLAWRLYVGMLAKMRYGETTFLLQFPIWWGYAACAFAAFIAAIVAAYSVYLHGKELIAGEDLVDIDRSLGH
ncbi:MAG: TRAP transporter small permease [Rhizobiaceae bacterium]